MEALTPTEPSAFVTSPIELGALLPTSDDREGSDDSDTLNEEVDVEKRNEELQKFFEQKMDNVGSQRSHSKISWEPEREDYIDAGAEVDRLANVFEHQYNFKVYKKRLHTLQRKSARQQINLHLAQFVHDEDGQDTLLIIYYAGHGIRDIRPGDLVLVGGNPKNGNKGLNQIVWSEAERHLEHTEADLFVIFDCCYAGQLAISTRSPFSNKIFEFLGATQAQATALAPSPQSFSTALAWALEKLASQPEGFTTKTLEHVIKQAPGFPETQVPCLADRREGSLRKLKIAPLSKEPTECAQRLQPIDKQDDEMIKYFASLQLLFSDCPDEDFVNDLTDHLKDLVRPKSMPLRQVLWRGLYSRDSDKTGLVKLAVWKWIHTTRRKTNSALPIIIQSPPGPERAPSPVLERKDTLSNGASSLQEQAEASQHLETAENAPAKLDLVRLNALLPAYVLIDRKNWNRVLPMLFLFCFAFALGSILSDFRTALALNLLNIF